MKIFKFLVFVAISILAIGCTNHQSDTDPTTPKLRSIEDYAWIGKLHNDFLDGIAEKNAIENTRSETDTIDWELVHQEHLNQVQALELESNYKVTLTTSLNASKPYYHTDNLYADIFPNNSLYEYYGQLQILLSRHIIDITELGMLKELGMSTKQNMDGEISNAELTDVVMNLCDKWNKKYGQSMIRDGEYSAHILAIAKSSMEWWSEADIPETRSASLVISADIAGALITAVTSASAQYLANKRIDGVVVAYSAVGGAIVGSTGIVGKAARFISKFIKPIK